MGDLFVNRSIRLFTYLSIILLLFLIVFEAFCLICFLFLPVLSSNFSVDLGALYFIFDIETRLSTFSARLTPFYALVFFYSWIIAMFRFLSISTRNNIGFTYWKGSRSVEIGGFFRSALRRAFKHLSRGHKCSRLLLAGSVAFAFCVAVYPYLPCLNPTGAPVGVDIPSYVDWLLEMDECGGLGNIFSYVFLHTQDRPLSLFLMYLGWKITRVSVFSAVKYLPALLAPLLVLAVYFFMLCAGFNYLASSLTALFTAFSYHITVGMYGALLSNWVGLIFFYLFLGFLLLGLRRRAWQPLVAALFFQAALLFSHSYTWETTLGILFVFLLITVLERHCAKANSPEPRMLAAVFLVCILTNVVKNVVLGVGLTAFTTEGVASTGLRLVNLQNLWHVLRYSLSTKMGITFMNPLLLFLASLGGIASAFDDRRISRLFTACALASSIPFVFGNWVVQTRIMYVLPLHILAFIGLLIMLNLVETLWGSFEFQINVNLSHLIFIFVVLVNLNFAFRCSLNLINLL